MNTPARPSDLSITEYDAAIRVLESATSSVSLWHATPYWLHLLARLNQLVLALYLGKPSPFGRTQPE